MDYAVFSVGGIALYETEHVEKLGTRASGVCIRQQIDNSHLLFSKIKKHGIANTIMKIEIMKIVIVKIKIVKIED